MKKILGFVIYLMTTQLVFPQSKNFFDFKVKNIVGDSVDLKIFKGRKILVVNTASYCGYTPQYADLQQLYENYKDRGFVIIGFPSNDFAGQEPGNDNEILDFCQSNYHVTFPMMSKISVTGSNIHPLYAWLTQKSQNGVKDAPVSWNFQKFLINEDGSYYDYLSPQASPLAPKITSWIDKGAGMDVIENASFLNVFPSPAKTVFTIFVQTEKPDKLVLRIYDSKGMFIDELYNDILEKELRIEYFTDRMPNGSYIVTAELGSQKFTQQLSVKKD